jgi:hypothetical protein
MIKLAKILNEITINSPQPIKDKIKDLIIKLVQNVDQFNMREIANVLGKYGYEDLIFDDAELYNPDFTRIKDLRSLYNDLQKVQSKLNINEIAINKPKDKPVSKEEILNAFKHFDNLGFNYISDALHAVIQDNDFINTWDLDSHESDVKPLNIIKRWKKQHIERYGINETNINHSVFYDDVTEKVIKGFKLIPFKQGFGKSFKSTSQKASPQLAERINKWIKNKFPESKTMVKYEKNYQTINFLYPVK